MTSIDLDATKFQAVRLFQRKRMIGFAIPAVIALYLAYIFFAFDLPGLAGRANLDNAVTLASDSWSHKVHVTRNNRSGEITYAVEGERKGRSAAMMFSPLIWGAITSCATYQTIGQKSTSRAFS